jgi:uncharacterized protein (DUF1810 family)
MKFRSCATLFARASGEAAVFVAALDIHCGGRPDPATLERLGRPQIV